MRILMLTEVFHPDTIGGAGRVAAELARCLASSSRSGPAVEVRVISRATRRAPAAFEKRDGFSIYRYHADLSSPLSAFRTTSKGVHAALDLALENFQPDILDIHQPHIAYHALRHTGLLGIPSVYTFHSSWSDELRIRGGMHALLSPVAARIETEVFRRFTSIVVLSEFSRRRVEEIRPSGFPFQGAASSDGSLTSIIPGGVDLDAFPKKEPPPDTGSAPPVIFTVRNLVKRMGLDSLIEAGYILKKRKRPFLLEIGGTGPLANELTSMAKELGTSCRFLGYIPEEALAEQYRRADLFILPTAAIEGFGLVILEAFASGTPVVGTPVGAIAEMVGLQGHGYVTASPSAEELARAIEFFLDRPDKPSPDQLRRIAEEYSWTRRSERMVDLYRSLLSSG